MNGIEGVSIFNTVDGRVEKFVDFYFGGKSFTVHWNFDDWIFFCNEIGHPSEFRQIKSIILKNNSFFKGYFLVFKGAFRMIRQK